MHAKLILSGALVLLPLCKAHAQNVAIQQFGSPGPKSGEFLLITGNMNDQNRSESILVETNAQFSAIDGSVSTGTVSTMAASTAIPPGRSTSGCLKARYSRNPRLSTQVEQRRATWFAKVAAAACVAGVPVAVFDALVAQESGYNPFAVSSKGATGLTQLMPETARQIGVFNIWDPVANLLGGARLLRSMLDRFGRFDLALAAYNAGPGRVRDGRIPMIPQTIHYVSAILESVREQVERDNRGGW